MIFKDYNSSQITPQMTLLKKFNKLIEWNLEHGYIIENDDVLYLYKHTVFINKGTLNEIKLEIITFDDNAITSVGNLLQPNLISLINGSINAMWISGTSYNRVISCYNDVQPTKVDLEFEIKFSLSVNNVNYDCLGFQKVQLSKTASVEDNIERYGD